MIIPFVCSVLHSLPGVFASPHLVSQQCSGLDRAASIEILPMERVRLREVK